MLRTIILYNTNSFFQVMQSLGRGRGRMGSEISANFQEIAFVVEE